MSIATEVLSSEWTKVRSVRSTYWTLFAAAAITIAVSAIACSIYVAQFANLSAQDRADLDPASLSLTGGILAQLAIAVLGVLVITSEYGSGMIRTTFAAVPQRLTVLGAKAAVFAAVTLVVTSAACVAAFLLGQAILSSKDAGVAINAPNALRTIIGTCLYLTGLGLLALGLGTLIRKTAGAITAVVGVIFVLPALSELLPSSLDGVRQVLPGNAAEAMLTGSTPGPGDPAILSAWVGLGVFLLYAVVALALAAMALVRRDA
jgi:ABC-type transport system involved in multi-copper enzyme maturation permease subunit